MIVLAQLRNQGCSPCPVLCRCINYITLPKPTAGVPRVTMPQRMVLKLQRMKGKQAAKKHQQKRTYRGQIIITSKRSNLNHHKGQTYSDFSPQHLSSGGWKSRASKGDHFTINATRGNPAWDVPEELSSFESVGLEKRLADRLQEFNITKPTNVQASAIPLLLRKQNVLCAAETGSGKTLAFVLPMLQAIAKQRELLGPTRDSNTPRGLILTPSRELADQIYAVTADLCDSVGLHPKLLVGGRGTQKILKYKPRHDVDLLITTPGVFQKVTGTRLYSASQLSMIVIDEADTLLDDSFSDTTIRLLHRMKISSENLDVGEGDCEVGGTQVAFFSATMPRSVGDILRDIVPIETLTEVTTPHLHKVMPHVTQKFVRTVGPEKPGELVKQLKVNMKKDINTLVFVNRSKTAYFLSYLLNENDIPHVLFHGDMSERDRRGRFERFQDDEAKVIVCTDIASRGLDTILAQHVINYEFPDFVSDYIHRVGRVGRVGSQKAGFALSYITHKWEVDALRKIETAVRKTAPFHNVNANIKRKLRSNFEKKETIIASPLNVPAP